LDEPLILPKIVLARNGWVDLIGNQNLFDAFDVRDSGALEFEGLDQGKSFVNVKVSSLPHQMTVLALQSVEWTRRPTQPHKFLALTVLGLGSMRIDGVLGNYLKLPSLKHLVLEDLAFVALEGASSDSTRLFSDKIFLQESPLLETISIDKMSMGDDFLEGLKSCTLLKNLTLEQCTIDRFIPPFLECLQESELFPCLDIISIINSWSSNLSMSSEEFRSQFAAKRPKVLFSDDTEAGQ
jgi:hypothetical protein